jgi:hypothetical protein
MLKYHANGPINALSASPSGTQVVVAGRDGKLAESRLLEEEEEMY